MSDTEKERRRAIDEFIKQRIESDATPETAVTATVENDVNVIVVCQDSLASNTMNAVEKGIDEALKQPASKVVLDLRHVKHMDSTAIAVIVRLLQKLKKIGKSLAIRNVSPGIFQVMTMLHFDRIMEIAPAQPTRSDRQ